jgi:hypothetical protein
MNLWTLFTYMNEHGVSMEDALKVLKPTRRECEIIVRQHTCVYDNVFKAISECDIGKSMSQTTAIGRPDGEVVNVCLGTDSTFRDAIHWIITLGAETCLQITADPESMLPPNNWDLFEVDEDRRKGKVRPTWTIKECEDSCMALSALNDYWREHFILPVNEEFTDLDIDAYFAYPLDGFYCTFEPSTNRPSVVAKETKRFIESIHALATEKTAAAYFAEWDAENLAKEEDGEDDEDEDD